MKNLYKIVIISVLLVFSCTKEETIIDNPIVKAPSVPENTFDGDISVITKSATVNAQSNHGKVDLDKFYDLDAAWELKSINGDITVEKQILSVIFATITQ